MVSGVGLARQLQEHNITVISHRTGIGPNMWNHVVLSIGRQVAVETYVRLSDVILATRAEATPISAGSRRTTSLTISLSRSYRTAEFATNFLGVEYELSIAPFGTPSFSTPENPIEAGS
ncbi:hypothetical protein AC579_1764 [Pseudocercospora musae]|uniref:Glucose-methanol-choline oxidoreductase N-terminal domain-containing protein n=1 Tax=Pseudocercospora musae TaxID=113226 RepID=A0A139INS7_9PEZI|nr:hypothetical protein AC579_1764 [Pseudocercospora musae]